MIAELGLFFFDFGFSGFFDVSFDPIGGFAIQSERLD
ncbi:Uncharacterised protein [Legionella pneumophila]|nr:Uncharacterised protein [Legionella pneumophila]